MRKQNIILFGFTVLLFTQCKSKNHYTEINTKQINVSLEYTVTQKSIHLQDSTNFDQFVTIQNDTNILLLFFNYHSGTVDYFDFNNDKLLKSIAIPKSELPFDENLDIGSIYTTNQDSIYLLSENYLLILNRAGKIIYKNPININIKDSSYRNNIFENLSKLFPIYRYNNKTYLPQRSYRYSLRTRNFYNTPVEAFLDDSTNTIHELKLRYPELYFDNYYGYLDFCYREAHDSLSIITFMADPNIYVYNYELNSYVIKGGKSSYQKKIIPLEKKYKDVSNKLIEYFTTSPFYSKILWDKYRKLYYRFFYCGLNIKNTDGTYNVFADKNIILMIFDSNFNLLKELKLDTHKYSDSRAFVTKDGLFLPKQNIFYKQGNPNTIQYDVYNFKTE